jgi:hypothetical protein
MRWLTFGFELVVRKAVFSRGAAESAEERGRTG